jgi:hypothetical protein
MAQLVNIRTVSIPSIGKLPLADNPGTFTPSGVKRGHKPGRLPEDGGFTEASTPARAEINLNLVPGTDVVAISAVKGEDVTVRLSDGHVHMMAQAFVEDSVQVGNGEAKIVLIANYSEQIA